MRYPADAQTLIQKAEANGAAPTTLKLLAHLPDRSYSNVSEVNHVLGEIESTLPSDQRIWTQGDTQAYDPETRMPGKKRRFDQNSE